MVVKESWLDPNQSELETTKIINVKKKKWKKENLWSQGPGSHHNDSHHSRQACISNAM